MMIWLDTYIYWRMLIKIFATASVVTRDVSAHTTTTMANIIVIEHSHLMMHVLAGSSMSAHSKFACMCNIAFVPLHTLLQYVIGVND